MSSNFPYPTSAPPSSVVASKDDSRQTPWYMSILDVSTLLFLGAIWGGAFPMMRVATAEFGPFALVGLRVSIGALVLLPILFRTESRRILRERKWAFFFVGLTSSGASFPLFAYATLNLGAGIGSVFTGLTPLFTSLVAWLWLRERLSPRQIGGIFVAWFGVILLSALHQKGGFSYERLSVLPILAALGATFLYGIGANLAKVHLAGVSASLISAGALASSALIDLPFAWTYWPETAPSLISWVFVFLLGAVCTAAAYLLYFRLVERIGVQRAIAVTFLVPPFGLFWGWLFLNESLSWGEFACVGLIFAGTAMLVSGHAKKITSAA